MAIKSLNKKHSGGVAMIQGGNYESNFFVGQLVKLFIPVPGEEELIEVTRQKTNAHVDDIYIKSKEGRKHFQCKLYADYNEPDLLGDFILQLREDNNTKVYLITQNKDRALSELVNAAKEKNITDFIKFLEEKEKNGEYKKHLKKLEKYIKTGDDTPRQEQRAEIHRVLQLLSIISYDEYTFEDEAKRRLRQGGYEAEANNIYNCLRKKADERTWLAKAVRRKDIELELKSNGIILKQRSNLSREYNGPYNNAPNNHGPQHMLMDASKPFNEKLSFLLAFIRDIQKIDSRTRTKILNIISQDMSLSWHFFKNLKQSEAYPLVEKNVLAISKEHTDIAVKFQVLAYLELCAEKFSDRIIPILVNLANNSSEYRVLESIVHTTSRLLPSSSNKLRPIWTLLKELTEHQHPWVRKEIPKAIKELFPHDKSKALDILRNLFLFKSRPLDVTQGSPVLALRFQGRDNENFVFEEAAKVLRELMDEASYFPDPMLLALELEKEFLTEEKNEPALEGDIFLDYSYIWFGDDRRVDYEYDRKKRIASEVERNLISLVKQDRNSAATAMQLLVDSKIEVFYLILIRILNTEVSLFIDIVEQIINNETIWKIHGLRAYNLQILIGKYLDLYPEKVSEFLKKVSNFKWKTEAKTIEYTKQDLLSAIPEHLRPVAIKKELAVYEKKLGTSSKVEKPFKFVSWSGPRPSIPIEELEKKGVEELVEIMSNNTSHSDPYDLAPSMAEVVVKRQDKTKEVLEKMKGKNIAPNFAGAIATLYIQNHKSDLDSIIDLYPSLKKEDSWAKIDLVRELRDCCYKPDVTSISKSQFERLKHVLFALANDDHPKDDKEITGSIREPGDGLTRGINSVRGIAAEALCALSFYYPDDKDVISKLLELADDPTNAVKVSLIFNLNNLLNKNYETCVKIVNKYRINRDFEIDFVLVRFFSCLNPSRLKQNMSFVKLLFSDDNPTIQRNLGEWIARRFIGNNDVDNFVDNIVRHRLGTKDCVQSLAFVFESSLPKLLAEGDYRRVMEQYAKLLSPQNDYEVVVRASFLFERMELLPEHLPIIIKYRLHEEIFKNKLNPLVQYHFLHYLTKCSNQPNLIPKVIDLLEKQVVIVDDLFNDHLTTQRVSEILTRALATKTKGVIKEKILMILNRGLERGWDEFYNLYFTYLHHA